MTYFQETFEERCLTTGAPKQLSFFTVTCSVIFLILNIPGNLLVILAVAINPLKNLRTPFNYLMVNLAFADLIVGVLIDPMSVHVHWKEATDVRITLPEIRAIHMSYFISCTASVLSLATLAVERYLAIRNPHTYRSQFTAKRLILTISLIWLISLIMPFIYLEVGYITGAFIFANSAVILVFIIMCFVHIMMVKKFRARSREVQESRTTTNYNEPTPTGPPTNAIRTSVVLWENKITKMFMVVLIALLCCYGPSTIFIYVMSFCESCNCNTLHWFRDLQYLFVLMNSSVNFYCYALRSPRFRNAFASMLRIKQPAAAQPAEDSGNMASLPQQRSNVGYYINETASNSA